MFVDANAAGAEGARHSRQSTLKGPPEEWRRPCRSQPAHIWGALSPSIPGCLQRRPDNGSAFSRFVEMEGKDALRIVDSCEVRSGIKLIRFETEEVCHCLNPLDGYGKPRAAETYDALDELRYWSMTPDELLTVRREKAKWIEVLKRDEIGRAHV